jgi:hypothetical protein
MAPLAPWGFWRSPLAPASPLMAPMASQFCRNPKAASPSTPRRASCGCSSVLPQRRLCHTQPFMMTHAPISTPTMRTQWCRDSATSTPWAFRRWETGRMMTTLLPRTCASSLTIKVMATWPFTGCSHLPPVGCLMTTTQMITMRMTPPQAQSSSLQIPALPGTQKNLWGMPKVFYSPLG